MSMFNPKKKEEVIMQQPQQPIVKDTKQLEKLFNELGTMKWIGSSSDWDRCVEAVRKRIVEIIKE
jgi:hypothetical protein